MARGISSAGSALRRLGLRQTLRGALIIGVLAGVMMGAQGAAMAAAYPTQQSRDALVASLKTVPGVGFLSGEIADAATPASYGIYKSIALMTIITGVWGLMVTTRLLRGQEEDGQLEQIVAGRPTKLSAGIHLLVGYGCSLILSFAIAWLIMAGLGADPKIGLSAGHAALMALAVYLPALFFGALGVLTSQLAVTRGRALTYGLVPLIILFAIRGAANSVSTWDWLKNWTPFGWSDLLNPVLDPHVSWILPTFIFALVAVPLGMYFAKKRDLGESILPQSMTARSNFFLLGSDLQFSIRQNIGTFIVWGVGSLAFTGLMTAIAKVGADLLTESPQAAKVFAMLGLSQSDLTITFLSFGGMFTVLILLFMTSIFIGNLRRQEAKGYMDNILIHPVSRTGWITRKLIICAVMTTVITLLSGAVIWVVAGLQGITLNPGILIQNSIALTGTLFLLLGIGTAFFGTLPRIAMAAMIVIIVWADTSDVLKALFKLNDTITKTSLLHYISFDLTKYPDWSQFAWLVGIGVVLMAFGVWRFTQRDIASE